ncbi:hypothetical protein BIFGAL_03493 [Bifidobacterium gallicum DSM 20093 = LMG 11596]|nr:hypothetical protein BIFGAL_03493 [Bifidobacterium gallicum DSM 20093 = LMG 11596]
MLPAKERMENAFWELLADREYHRITVTDVVRMADVNRNSFYYHFSGLPELADAAILREVENIPRPATPQAHMHLRPETEWRFYCTSLLEQPEQRRRIDRLALLTGSNSAPELRESLRDFMRLTFISLLDLDPETIDKRTSMLINFSVGGLISILQDWAAIDGDISVEELMDEDTAMLVMGLYMAMSKESLRTYWRRAFATERPLPNYITASLAAPAYA